MLFAAGLVSAGAHAAPPEKKMSPEEATEFYRKAAKSNAWPADITILYNISEVHQGQRVIQEALSYERNPGGYFSLLFTKPKTEHGSGYLRVGRNLWFFDRGSGSWERRTNRERLGGSNVHESDFVRTLLDDYDVAHEGYEDVGGARCTVLRLTAQAGRDVPYPSMLLWLDKDLLEVKRQEFAASGKLLRTGYAGKFKSVYNPFAKKDVFLRGQIVIYDEVIKGSVTTVTMKAFEFKPHPDTIFSKAWLESKSR